MEKREVLYNFSGNVNWCSDCGKQCGVSSKVKNSTTIWFSNSTSGYVSKGNGNNNLKIYKDPHVHCNIIYNCQDVEATQVSTGGWMDKEMFIYIYNTVEYYSAIKRRKSYHLLQDGWTSRAWCPVRQVRERQMLCDVSYTRHFETTTTAMMTTPTHQEMRSLVTRGGGGGGRGSQCTSCSSKVNKDQHVMPAWGL